MSYQTGNELGVAICDALGINADTIHTIRLEMSVNDVAELTTIGYVDQTRSVAEAVRHYTILKRAGWAPPWSPPRLGDVYYKATAG